MTDLDLARRAVARVHDFGGWMPRLCKYKWYMSRNCAIDAAVAIIAKNGVENV